MYIQRRKARLVKKDRLDLIRLVRLPKKGLGVVAKTFIPPHTYLAMYPGWIYTLAMHKRARIQGLTNGVYALNGLYSIHMLDPGNKNTVLNMKRIAPFVNEPTYPQKPTALWVRNFKRKAVELWSGNKPIRRNQEVTVCYGSYARKYTTTCDKAKVRRSPYGSMQIIRSRKSHT
jgi:hypothetical protein